MINQFRHLYPQGSIISELIDIDRGLYLVKVAVQDRGNILSTGLAGGETIEKAEDRARERALMTLNLETSTIPSPPKKSELPQKPIEIPHAKTKENDSRSSTLNANPHQTVTTRNSIPAPKPVIETAPEPEVIVSTFTASTVPEEFPPEATPENLVISESPTNIFDQPIADSSPEDTKPVAEETIETVEIDFNVIKHKTDLEMKRLNWTKEQGRDYLLSTYGKRSRLHLTDGELLEFWDYLKTIPN